MEVFERSKLAVGNKVGFLSRYTSIVLQSRAPGPNNIFSSYPQVASCLPDCEYDTYLLSFYCRTVLCYVMWNLRNHFRCKRRNHFTSLINELVFKFVVLFFYLISNYLTYLSMYIQSAILPLGIRG